MQFKRPVFALSFIVLLISVGIVGLIVGSLPQTQGQIRLPALNSKVTVIADNLGVPAIVAESREDAFQALGYLHARDRLFQMELMRRRSAGRLAELFGSSAVALDRQQRSYQFSRAADNIVEALPSAQRHVLQAYVAGVNAYIQQARILPPEFLVLQHQPEPWREQDSILVALGMFQNLNGQEYDERMVSVMEKALPPELVKFLTPDTDEYSTVLVGGAMPRRYTQTIPVQAFANLPTLHKPLARNSVDVQSVLAGSNNWVVAGSKTADGRAIVANDMHLGLSVPNIWYRANLQYQQQHIYGVSLPGVPAIVVGGNDHVAWGFTNVTADLLDLVRLDIHPENPQLYLTQQGWTPFENHHETMQVKNAPAIELTVQNTIWGPVSPQPLLGQPVAVKWTALAGQAVDLGLLAMDEAKTVKQAMQTMNQAGGPPQNVVFADTEGHIGWTYMGRFPLRSGFDGLVSRSWAAGNVGWQGYILPTALPRLFDPPEGFIVTANNRTLGRDYPYAIAHNWALGYRAYRIAERLRAEQVLTEQDLFKIQLDTRSAVYDFYQQLALQELRNVKPKDHVLLEVEQTLKAWDGHMRIESIGAAFLDEFRGQLASRVFAKVVAACQGYDPEFRYAWRELETPLRLLLRQRPPGILENEDQNAWGQMIIEALRATSSELKQAYPEIQLDKLTWGQTHTMKVQHPFSQAMPFLARVLDMAPFASDGCASVCVKVMGQGHSASERLVLSPAHPQDAIFHMPGGQSGHFLSTHYRDQQAFWQKGEALPWQGSSTAQVLRFSPMRD